MDTNTQPQNGEPTNYDILEAINDFASATDRRFEKLEADIGTLKADVGTLKADVGTLKVDVGTLKADVVTLKADVVTLKADVVTIKTDVVYLKSQMVTKEYLDDKLADLRGDIIVMLRKEDKRLTSLIELLHGKRIISDEETKTLITLQPLLQIP